MEKVIVIGKKQVEKILAGNEEEIIEIVQRTYISFQLGKCRLPHSSFLRFNDNSPNRIISLPAYVEDINTAGIKWISSFPRNINNNLERASATILLNSLENGMVNTIIEGSVISAKRTAAGAVAAARELNCKDENTVGIIGCGRINYETLLFYKKMNKGLDKIYAYDISADRSQKFINSIPKEVKGVRCDSIDLVFANSKLLFVATTVNTPFISKEELVKKEHTIIDTSLRDFGTNIVRKCINIVDSIEHVNREQTSLNLTYMESGKLDFDVKEIGEIYIDGNFKRDKKPVLYSAFGLGVLDVSLAKFVKDKALRCNEYLEIDNFYG